MYMYMHMYLRHNVHTFVRVEKFQSVEMKCVIEFDRKLLGRKIIVMQIFFITTVYVRKYV